MECFDLCFEGQLAFDIHYCGLPVSIYESHGYSDEVYRFTKMLVIHAKQQLVDTIQNKTKIKVTYTERDLKPSDCFVNFFDEYEVNITTEYKKPYKKISYNKGCNNDNNKSMVIRYGDMFKLKPVINVNVFSDFEPFLASSLFVVLGHEYTHAYSTYCIINSYKKSVNDIIGDNNRMSVNGVINKLDIFHISDYSLKTGEQYSIGSYEKLNDYLKEFVYLTSPVEINAIIGQLRNELDTERGVTNDIRSYVKLVKDTDTYQNIKNARKYTEELINYIRKNFDEDNRKIYNTYLNTNFTTIEQFEKYMSHRCDVFERNMLDKSCDMICDIISDDNKGNFYDPHHDLAWTMEMFDYTGK